MNQLHNRANRANPNLAIIEEKAEDGGTLYMDNIKLQVRDSARKRDSDVP